MIIRDQNLSHDSRKRILGANRCDFQRVGVFFVHRRTALTAIVDPVSTSCCKVPDQVNPLAKRARAKCTAIRELHAAEFWLVPLLPLPGQLLEAMFMSFCSSAHSVVRLAVVILAFLFVSGQRTAFAQASVPAADPAAQGTQSPPIAPQASQALMTEPGFLTSAMTLIKDRFGDGTKKPKSGFYPEFSNMTVGSGLLSVGPGYRQYFADDHAMFDISGAISYRLYKVGQARFELSQLAENHLTLGTQFMWQDSTQINYFGIGPDVDVDTRTQYRTQSHDLVGYGIVQTTDWLNVTGKIGWLGHPKLMDPGGWNKRDVPSALDAFPNDPAVGLSTQPALLHSEAAITADTRDHRGHPTRGFMYRGALMNFWDKTYETYTFHTWEAEGLQFVPVADGRVVLVFHGWTVAGKTTDTNDIPMYLLPSIGGKRTLRAYHDFQFHDRNLLNLSAESRFAVWTHLDLAVFGDAGNVAHRYRDLDLDHTAVGAGVRIHNGRTTILRLDVAHGSPGWHATFTTSEPLRLERVRRLTAAIPFAP
jgi:hypothetical protein